MACASTYRNQPAQFSDSENDDDSDGREEEEDSDVWKRMPKKLDTANQRLATETMVEEPCPAPVNEPLQPLGTNRKRKLNTVWSSVAQEQMLDEDLGQIGLKSKPVRFHDRTCENYDFTRRELDRRDEYIPQEGLDMDTNFGNEEVGDEVPRKYRKHDFHRSDWGKFVRLSKEDTIIARKIIYILNEPKQYLIYRIVHFLGAEKAMQLLKMTEEVEDKGGLNIKNNTRRRSPGGVYLSLLKEDKDIAKEDVDNIFACEPKLVKGSKRKQRKPKKKSVRFNDKEIEAPEKTLPGEMASSESERVGDMLGLQTTSDDSHGILQSKTGSNSDEEDQEVEVGEIIHEEEEDQDIEVGAVIHEQENQDIEVGTIIHEEEGQEIEVGERLYDFSKSQPVELPSSSQMSSFAPNCATTANQDEDSEIEDGEILD